jgi:CRISPR-associated protein Cmr4
MYKQKSALFLLCETPLHAGSGDDLGLVDLPIQRERHTAFPKIEASSLKGALREAFENTPGKEKDTDFQINVHRVFGYDEAFERGITSEEDLKKMTDGKVKTGAIERNALLKPISDYFGDDKQFSGCLALTDARLLLFPVKSMKGVFVWLTCPQVLNKFATDMHIAGISVGGLEDIKALEVRAETAVTASSAPLHNAAVILEEFAFDAAAHNAVQKFAVALSELLFADPALAYWKGLLQKNLIVLNDTDFRDFTTMSTEVITRTKIDNETGTVDAINGALFTEEYLPTESVLYALAGSSDEFTQKTEKKSAEDVMAFFTDNMQTNAMFQLGGNATLGKGILRTIIKNGTNNG